MSNRVKRCIASAVLALAAGHAAAQPAQPAQPALVWDLTRLYPTDAAWEADRAALTADVPQLAALRPGFGASAAALRGALDRLSAADQKLTRLWVYASTQISTANGDARNQERQGLVFALWGQVSSATAWVDSDLQALGAETITAYQAAEPGLARQDRRLRDALRRRPHTLAPEVESALADVGPVLDSFSGTRELLVNSDIAWPEITVDGRTERLSDTVYERLRRHPDREVRRRVFQAFWQTYGQYANTLGALLAQRVNRGVIEARLRRHPSAAAAALFDTQVPEAVLRTLVAETQRTLPTLHRYFRLRQKLLKLPDLHYHDIYPNLVDSSRAYPPAESAEITLAAMKPLGDEYAAQLELALAARTMHVRPQAGKRGGAYATGVYGQPPFIFLNHDDSFESLITFAHEWGHGMHNVMAQRAQPPEKAGYPLFLAEIASTTNEVLLTDHMLRQAKTDGERISVLAQVLERLRAAYYRQTMFAEFELAAHDAQQRGEALSGRKFTDLYCGLLRKYHGEAQGVMAIDPAYCAEWAYVPHFHRPFYVYAYATSTVAAQFFAERMLRGEPGAREAYLDVLRAGGSTPPHDLLLKAGLDLTSAAPYQMLARRMEAVMDEVERLVGR